MPTLLEGKVVFQIERTTGLTFLTAIQGNKAISWDPLILVTTVANVTLFYNGKSKSECTIDL